MPLFSDDMGDMDGGGMDMGDMAMDDFGGGMGDPSMENFGTNDQFGDDGGMGMVQLIFQFICLPATHYFLY